MELRKKKNLCFNCDKVYHPGHKCKKLFVIMGVDSEGDDEVVLDEKNSDGEDFHISVHALAGQTAPDTIKLLGTSCKHQLSVLIDTGSTHSFLDSSTARKLGCELEYTNPLLVTIADGGKIECNAKCPKFEWEMGQCRFTAAMRILKLGGCDMVVGVDLLRQLGPITFDFDNHRIKFNRQGKEITL